MSSSGGAPLPVMSTPSPTPIQRRAESGCRIRIPPIRWTAPRFPQARRRPRACHRRTPQHGSRTSRRIGTYGDRGVEVTFDPASSAALPSRPCTRPSDGLDVARSRARPPVPPPRSIAGCPDSGPPRENLISTGGSCRNPGFPQHRFRIRRAESRPPRPEPTTVAPLRGRRVPSRRVHVAFPGRARHSLGFGPGNDCQPRRAESVPLCRMGRVLLHDGGFLRRKLRRARPCACDFPRSGP